MWWPPCATFFTKSTSLCVSTVWLKRSVLPYSPFLDVVFMAAVNAQSPLLLLIVRILYLDAQDGLSRGAAGTPQWTFYSAPLLNPLSGIAFSWSGVRLCTIRNHFSLGPFSQKRMPGRTFRVCWFNYTVRLFDVSTLYLITRRIIMPAKDVCSLPPQTGLFLQSELASGYV